MHFGGGLNPLFVRDGLLTVVSLNLGAALATSLNPLFVRDGLLTGENQLLDDKVLNLS